MKPIYVIGYPGSYGGACTELWHTLKLWRAFGWEVHMVPTWGPPEKAWQEKVSAIGCTTHVVEVPPPVDDKTKTRDKGKLDNWLSRLRGVPGLEGGIAVAFCNEAFLGCIDLLRGFLNCRVVWANCMNWLFPAETAHYALFGGFDAYMFQSGYQRDTLLPKLASYNVQPSQCHLIPGAFDPTEFPFRPRPFTPPEEFVAGRLSRTDPAKHSTNTWPILDRVGYRPFRYRVLGWDRGLNAKIGQPPPYADCLAPNSEDPQKFLAGLHSYCQIAGAATENWPRAGLEAMATGVPIVVEGRGGWCEMLTHNKTGFLCTPENPDAEIAHWVTHMALDPDRRLEIATAARRRVEELSDPEPIRAGWEKLFKSLPAAPKKRAARKRAPRKKPTPRKAKVLPLDQGA